jgi:hypothetical protein
MYQISFQRGPDTTDWLSHLRPNGCGVCILLLIPQTTGLLPELPRLRRFKGDADHSHKAQLQVVLVVRVSECGSDGPVLAVCLIPWLFLENTHALIQSDSGNKRSLP